MAESSRPATGAKDHNASVAYALGSAMAAEFAATRGLSMRPQVLEMGLATAAELDELDNAARAHLDDPDTVVIYGLLFLTWGRKPGGG